MEKCFFILAIILSLTQYEAANIDYTAVSCKVGDEFCSKQSTAFLCCYYAVDFPDTSYRCFDIIPLGGEFQDVVVGKIGTQFSLAENRVEITRLDVDKQYRKRGYGEAALRIVLGIYRNEQNSNLAFNHFFLSVGLLDEDRSAARNLYAKIGFVEQSGLPEEEERELKAMGYCNLLLNR